MPKKESLDKLIHQGLLSYPDARVTLREFEESIQVPCRDAIKSLLDIGMGKLSRKIIYSSDSDTDWVGVGLKAGSRTLCAGVYWDRTMKQVTRGASVGVYFSSPGEVSSVREALRSLGEEPDEPEEDNEDEKYAVWLSENIKVASLDGVKKAIQRSLKGWTTAGLKLRKILNA